MRRLPAGLGLALLGLLVLAGAGLRVWILGHDAMNSDEAIVGLTALGILHGHLTAFVWSQPYGGVEPYVVAAVFGLFGSSPFTLNLTPVLLAAAISFVTWLIARRLLPAWAAATAAVLSWVWPESTIFDSTREYGYHEIALLAGLVVFLGALRIVQAAGGPGEGSPGFPGPWWPPGGVADWALVGLVAGVGWWASPEVTYYLVPSAVLLVVGLHRRKWAAAGTLVATAAVTFLIGLLPWLVAGADDRWATIKAARATPQSGPYHYRLEIFFTHVLPMLLGLRVEGAGLWEGGRTVGHLLYAATAVIIVAAAVAVCRRWPLAWSLVLLCAVLPFVYAAFPTAWFWNDGRYGIFLTPPLALILIGAAAALESPKHPQGVPGPRHAPPPPAPRVPSRLLSGARSPAAAGAVAVLALCAATASTALALQSSFGLFSSGAVITQWHTNPEGALVSTAAAIEHRGVHDAYAGYWVAYDLELASSSHLLVVAVGDDRNPVQGHRVASSPRAAWVFPSTVPARLTEAVNEVGAGGDLNPPGVTATSLAGWLRAHHIGYTTFDTGPFVVVLPAANVTPRVLGLA